MPRQELVDGIGITGEHCKRATGFQTNLKQVMRNLAHSASQQFILNLGHSMRPFSPLSRASTGSRDLGVGLPYGPTWDQYDEYRAGKGIAAVIPKGRLLFSTAGQLEILRIRNQTSADDPNKSWGPSTEPGMIRRCRDYGRRKSRVDLLREPASGSFEIIPPPPGV